jgi:hypothetical protein
MSDGSSPSVSKLTGRGSYSACGLVTTRVVCGAWNVVGRPEAGRAPAAPDVPAVSDAVLCESSKSWS